MNAVITGPDERALRAHLDSGEYLAGVTSQRWQLLSLQWPHAIMKVEAAPRPASPTHFTLRFLLDSYPHRAPTGNLWDITTGDYLAAQSRPKGGRAGHVFRVDGHTGGFAAMYAPWDRVALESHADWAQVHAREAWHPQRNFTFVLDKVQELLTADDYVGI